MVDERKGHACSQNSVLNVVHPWKRPLLNISDLCNEDFKHLKESPPFFRLHYPPSACEIMILYHFEKVLILFFDADGIFVVFSFETS